MTDHVTPLTPPELESSFRGDIIPNRLSWPYRLGLFIVAVAMVVLPLCYVGLLVLAGWVVKWHLVENAWLVSGRGGGTWRLLAYLGPAIAGLLLLFFLVKPLFARTARRTEPLELDSRDEPVLYAFIARICALVRAPEPARVRVDCQVNASASFDGGLTGLLRRRLVLTIGLPLAAGLTARQLGGVLAHEFGHFAQGAGMGVTFVIRSVNGWFARVVYQRDEWDERLDRWSRNTDWRLAAVLWLARLGVWLSRRVLHGLMLAGNALSCFMSRQMEFDADYYEAAVAGSDSFVATMKRLPELGAACHESYRHVFRSRESGRVPDDFPAFVSARAASLPPDVREALASAEQAPRTRLFDTHPADEERIRSAGGLASPGVLAVEGPAARLFADFAALSRRATRHHYGAELGLDVEGLHLLDTAHLLHEARTADHAQQALRRYFRGVLLATRPIAPAREIAVAPGLREAAARLAVLREAAADAAPAAREAAGRYFEQEKRWHDAMSALVLLDSGLSIEPEEFQLAEGTRDEAKRAADDALAAQQSVAPALERFEHLQAERLALVLSLAGRSHDDPAEPAIPGDAGEVERLSRTLHAVADAWPAVLEARRYFVSWNLLVGNRALGEKIRDYALWEDLAGKRLRASLAAILARIGALRFPFQHAEQDATMATYLRGGGPPPDAGSDEELYAAADGHLDRCLAIYYDLLGRLAAIATEIEHAVLPEALAGSRESSVT